MSQKNGMIQKTHKKIHLNYELKRETQDPVIPKEISKTFNNRGWSTVLEAEKKSRHRRIVDMLESEDKKISLYLSVSVEWPTLKPDWEDGSKEIVFK